MRRKEILSLLLNGQRQDYDLGIHLAKELGFGLSDYGWNLDMDDETSRNALTVDAYLNVNETLFESESIFDLMRCSGLHAFIIYGVTIERECLFDTRLSATASGTLESTNITAQLRSPEVQEAYSRLSLSDKYRMIDQLFQPNGYTVMGYKPGAMRHFASCRTR